VLIAGVFLLMVGGGTVALSYLVPSLRAQVDAGTASRQKLLVLPTIGVVLVIIGLVI
jgi:hypothetical protein